MFRRPHHQRIERLLHAFNAELLAEAECYFAGGTAIVLLTDEYRESRDIDFLCASKNGYRLLRNSVSEHGLGALLRIPIKHLRDVRADRYGIRTVLEIDGIPIKTEFVSEGRIEIAGEPSRLPLPTLARADLYAEKLLANADRGLDRTTMSRDIIDLAMMIHHWGAIPEAAWCKVSAAYGEQVKRAYLAAVERVSDPLQLRPCLQAMAMDEGVMPTIVQSLRANPAPG